MLADALGFVATVAAVVREIAKPLLRYTSLVIASEVGL